MNFEDVKNEIKNLGQYKTLAQIKAAGLCITQNDAGDYWLIEKKFLKPAVKSPRECNNILVDQIKLKYKLLLCSKTKEELENTATLQYISWGEKEAFDQRASTKGRNRWWDLGKRKPAGLNFNYLINDVGDTYVGSVFVSDNFHEIHTEKHLEVFLNSTVFWLFQNLSGRTSFGGGLLKIQTYELERIFVLEVENKFDFPVLKRAPKSVFKECGINPESTILIEEQEPNPLPDRAELDKVVFDALELTEDERKDVYRAVCSLVWNRISKAQSV
ncbi:MAG: hypothetical protein HYR90_00860 [Candidatus Andersenbacteria bacterium]|nr:hypothetical protein [Candidatus Andersenbacteria bacterium]MBI3251201.1 hypothetical protein [Candidatus Andersenbacteria bacterium]